MSSHCDGLTLKTHPFSRLKVQMVIRSTIYEWGWIYVPVIVSFSGSSGATINCG